MKGDIKQLIFVDKKKFQMSQPKPNIETNNTSFKRNLYLQLLAPNFNKKDPTSVKLHVVSSCRNCMK